MVSFFAPCKTLIYDSGNNNSSTTLHHYKCCTVFFNGSRLKVFVFNNGLNICLASKSLEFSFVWLGLTNQHWYDFQNHFFLQNPHKIKEVLLSTLYHTSGLDTIFIQIYMDALPGVPGVSKNQIFFSNKTVEFLQKDCPQKAQTSKNHQNWKKMSKNLVCLEDFKYSSIWGQY